MIPLLIDENLSRKLLNPFKAIFPGSKHVVELQLGRVDDLKIWDFARDNGFCILTKDWDFQVMSALYDCPPKVIRINCGNKATNRIVEIITSKLDIILDFQKGTNNCYLSIE